MLYDSDASKARIYDRTMYGHVISAAVGNAAHYLPFMQKLVVYYHWKRLHIIYDFAAAVTKIASLELAKLLTSAGISTISVAINSSSPASIKSALEDFKSLSRGVTLNSLRVCPGRRLTTRFCAYSRYYLGTSFDHSPDLGNSDQRLICLHTVQRFHQVQNHDVFL